VALSAACPCIAVPGAVTSVLIPCRASALPLRRCKLYPDMQPSGESEPGLWGPPETAE